MAGAVRSEQYQQLIQAMVLLRKETTLSQAGLAKVLSKPPSFVGKYELGERRLDVVETFVVLKALGVEPIEFLEIHLWELPARL